MTATASGSLGMGLGRRFLTALAVFKLCFALSSLQVARIATCARTETQTQTQTRRPRGFVSAIVPVSAATVAVPSE